MTDLLRPVDPYDDPYTGDGPDTEGTRRLHLTWAHTIKPRPVYWLWKGRLALGTLGLLAGREGLGKSTLAYWIAARITRGDLYGCFHNTPKTVLVAATEDSWAHTIIPRLIAADADLTRVARVEVITAAGTLVGLSLVRDLGDLEQAARATDTALLIMDPLMSRLGDLDTHKDAEVRQALEPLVACADRTNMAVLGLIHHNKSASTDPLQLVMGSKAFTAVARSVHTVVPDPDDDTDQRRLFGTPKNNLGRIDLPTFSFTIQTQQIDTDEGPAHTGRLEWGEELSERISDAMSRTLANGEERNALAEAAEWLTDYLHANGGQVERPTAIRAAKFAGHSESTLRRAHKRLGLVTTKTTKPGAPHLAWWELPPPPATPPSSNGQSVQA